MNFDANVKTLIKTAYLFQILCCIFVIYAYNKSYNSDLPVVINTWNFLEANKRAWDVLKNGGSALDAIETGCTACEQLQCDGTVGYGGSPDENGETTLDAMIIDGMTMNIGAVAALRRIKDAISVARHVLERTKHTMLVGDQATEFAIKMGFKEETLSTNTSEHMWQQWKKQNCQPNFWMPNVTPDPRTSCGPYKPSANEYGNKLDDDTKFDKYNHDTIGMVAIDKFGYVAAGTSTNGARHKIPGRVGDGPIPGAGAYAEKDVGGAAATGDGDIMMRFLPSLKAVEELKRGLSAKVAARLALRDIIKYYEKQFSGAIVVLSITGELSAACYGMETFSYSVSYGEHASFINHVDCIK